MLTNGTLLDNRYLVLNLIGTGTFARTYRVRDVGRQTLHVLQVLEPHFADVADVRERFLAEGRRQARLEHPHLVAVTDVLTTPVPGIVTALVEGPTLRAHLTALGRPLTYAEVLELSLPVLDALGAAHAAGILHRALAPELVVLATGPDGRRAPAASPWAPRRRSRGAGRTRSPTRSSSPAPCSSARERSTRRCGPR